MNFWNSYVVPFLPALYGVALVVKRFAADHTIAYKIADSILTGGVSAKSVE